MGERRHVAYCLKCGGDVFEDGDQQHHRCRSSRLLVHEMIALKRAVHGVKARFERKPLWPPSMQSLYDELNQALDDMTKALQQFERRP